MSEAQHAGLTAKALTEAVGRIKAGKKANSASAETTYDALAKYGTNLCQRAANGKLIP